MKLGSLFSGGGLGDFGFMAAGMEIAWQVEIDEYCQKILALRYPESKKYTDIKTLKGGELEQVDIITGGFPCQPFSTAGKRRGTDDNRYLWPEMFRVIREHKPRWVIGENVPGIVNMALDFVCSDLEKEDYSVQTIIFPSHALGARHRRDRVWIVAHTQNHNRRTGQFGREKEEIRSAWNDQSSRSSDDERKSWGNGWWEFEPAVGRRLNGYPDWLDFHIGKEMSHAMQIRYNKKLRELWNPIMSQALWKAVGGFNRIQKAEILFAFMCEYEKDSNKTWILTQSEEALKNFVRSLWLSEKITRTSSGSENNEQHQREHSDALSELSRLLAHNLQEDWTISCWEDGIPRIAEGMKDRVNKLKLLGNGQVPACTYVIGKMIMDIEKEA